MEKHQKRIVTEMFKSLQWDLILEQYEGVDYKIKGIKLSKEKAKVTKEHIKKELTDVFEYMLDMQLDSLELDHWLIRWSNINEKSKLEVIFIPRRVIIREDELCPEEEFVVINDDILDTQEKLALEKLLHKAEEDENYELCGAIYSRLKNLNKIIKRNETKKHREHREVRT